MKRIPAYASRLLRLAMQNVPRLPTANDAASVVLKPSKLKARRLTCIGFSQLDHDPVVRNLCRVSGPFKTISSVLSSGPCASLRKNEAVSKTRACLRELTAWMHTLKLGQNNVPGELSFY